MIKMSGFVKIGKKNLPSINGLSYSIGDGNFRKFFIDSLLFLTLNFTCDIGIIQNHVASKRSKSFGMSPSILSLLIAKRHWSPLGLCLFLRCDFN
jgi:hypothetical protein